MVIALDPGIRTAGFALEKRGYVVQSPWPTSTRGPKSLEAARVMGDAIVRRIESAVDFRDAIALLVVELSAGRGRAETSQDMANVAAVVGVVVRALRDVPVVAVAPAQWNSGRRKGTWFRAVREWGGEVAPGTPKSLEHNALDALGVLLWWELSGGELSGGAEGGLAKYIQEARNEPTEHAINAGGQIGLILQPAGEAAHARK